MLTVLLIFAVPVLFIVVTWSLVTMYRICFPEEAAPIEYDPVFVRRRAAAMGTSVPVGAREIREDQRVHQRQHTTEYLYETGLSDGFPEAWRDDLWLRRN